MIRIREAQSRGFADLGWLRSWHTFSFGSYYDAEHVRFRNLRVMNEDLIAPGQGFGTHPHENMEIITYVLSGELEHRDSMGHGDIIRSGEFQRMTAGTGITHSEFNPSAKNSVHLYQVWLLPKQPGLPPEYQQQSFPKESLQNRWQLVAAPHSNPGSLQIQADASIYLANLNPGERIDYSLNRQRHAWLQVLKGEVVVRDHVLKTSDGAAISEETDLRVQAGSQAEIMLFDLA